MFVFQGLTKDFHGTVKIPESFTPFHGTWSEQFSLVKVDEQIEGSKVWWVGRERNLQLK